MNKSIIILILFFFCSLANAEETSKLDQIASLGIALEKGGIPELLTIVKQHQWEAPHIRSKWSVTHRSGSEAQQKTSLASREFGRILAEQLDSVAPRFQNLPPGVELNRQAQMLCDLSDWCASTPGYGNLFLAQRCLDLASVGLTRLTASPEVPLAECEKLASRMSPAWMSVEVRAEALNDEAGGNLFNVEGSQAELEKTWGSGGFLLREKRSGVSRQQGKDPGRGFIETPTLGANLDFFERDAPGLEPLTLVRSWDAKRFERIVNGLELQNVNKALALVKFRTVIGQFPEKIYYTEKQLRERDEMRVLHEKHGVKANISDKDHVSGKAAFLHAWDQRTEKRPEDHNLDAVAWQAYSEVKACQFLDQDMRTTQMSANDIHSR